MSGSERISDKEFAEWVKEVEDCAAKKNSSTTPRAHVSNRWKPAETDDDPHHQETDRAPA